MKKLLIFLLSLSMLFSLSACGGEEQPPVAPEQPPVEQPPVQQQEELPEEPVKEFSLGVVEDGVYHSDFLSMGFALPEGWEFYTREQIMEFNNAAYDTAGEEYQEIVESADVVFDMYASGPAGDSVNVTLEKIDEATLEALDIKENFALLEDTFRTSFENMGLSDIAFDITDISVDGRDLPAMLLTGKIEGVEMYQLQFNAKYPGYLAAVTAVTLYEDGTQQLLDGIYWTE